MSRILPEFAPCKGSKAVFSLPGLTLIALAATLPAQGGFTPITTCNPLVSATASPSGSLIDVPGDYEVAADLNNAPPADCIFITVSNVALKLNGHKIIGLAAAPSTGAGIDVASPAGARLNHVVIEGPGLIELFEYGVSLAGCDYCQVGLVTSAFNNQFGIYALGVTFATVSSNVAVANAQGGLRLNDSANGVFQSNKASGNGNALVGFGIVAEAGANNTLLNNTADANGLSAPIGVGIGIDETGDRISGNTTDGNKTNGIDIAAGAAGNVIFNNPSSVGNGAFDMQDNNAGCGTDTWSNNVFFTASPVACIH